MTLVRVAMPETESHLALMVCALNAEDIPYLVHNAGMGALYPGLQIGAYNARSIMVPESCSEHAIEIIAELHLEVPTPHNTPRVPDKLRMLLEMILMGWFLPRGMRRSGSSSDDA